MMDEGGDPRHDQTMQVTASTALPLRVHNADRARARFGARFDTLVAALGSVAATYPLPQDLPPTSKMRS